MASETAAHGIRGAICPGTVVDTAMRMSIEAQQRRYGLPETAEREKSMPIGRVSVPADAARIAAFLASDDASYITGVSGGLLMDWPPTSAREPSGQGFRSPKDVPKM